MDLEAKVFDALNNAVANGYDMISPSVQAIAEDMANYDADLEKIDVKTLVPLVRKWRLSNG